MELWIVMPLLKYIFKDSLSVAYNQLTLTFTDTDLERRFFEFYTDQYLGHGRVCLVLALFFYSFYGLFDQSLFGDAKQKMWFIRYVVVAPAFIFGFVYSYSKSFKVIWQYLFVGYVLLTGGGYVYMVAITPSSKGYLLYTGIVFSLFFNYAFIRLRVIFSSLAGWLITIGYSWVTFSRYNWPDEVIVYDLPYIVGINILGMLIGYFIELSARNNFLLIKNLKQSQEALAQRQTDLQDRNRELMKAQKETHLAMKRAESASRAKSVFLASMSHELRTPLNAILGFSEVIGSDTGLSPHHKKNLEIINRSGVHLLQLINDVLDMSKIEAGKAELYVEDMELAALIRDVVDMMQIPAKQKGLSLIFDQSSDFPRCVRADGPKIRQILINLLSNAIKFTDEGDVTLRLLSETSPPDAVILRGEVRDTGRGIHATNIERAFKPFEQLTANGEQKGTGLGLAITRRFVEMMGGEISASSQPGEGSTFSFSITVASCSSEQIPVAGKKETRQIISLVEPEQAWRILIVEDNPENQLLLRELLEKVGFQVRIAENGEKAIAVFKQWRPHLIWMDRRMPVMDGLTTTREIRQLSGGKEVKIVALTASVLKEQKDKVMAAGSDDFINKPYQPIEIFDCMAKHLDVRYVYAETQTADPADQIKVTPQMLATLPGALLKDLKQAVIELDTEKSMAVIKHIAEKDADLGAALKSIAENLDYTMLLVLVEAVSRQNGVGE